MKKIVIGLVLLSALLFSTVEASTIRYRGGSFDRYRELLSQYKYTSAARQRNSEPAKASRLPTQYIQRSSHPTVHPDQRRFAEREISVTNNAPTISATRKNVPLKTFSADNYAFSINLPEDFVKISDTLTPEKGMLYFRKDDTFVRVFATDRRCDQIYSLVESCLIEESNSFAQDLMDRINIEIREKQTIRLENTSFEFDRKTKLGRYVDFFNRDLQVAHLTFMEPLSKNVWRLEIMAPNRTGNLAGNEQMRYDIFNSPFRSEKIEASSNRSVYLPTRTSIGNTVPTYLRRYEQGISSNTFDYETHRANKIPFRLELPSGFQKIADTLTLESGVLRLEDGKDTVAIMATSNICKDQTPRVVRRCMDNNSETIIDNYKKTLPSHIILEDQNREVRLTRDSESYGRYFLAKIIDNGRVALLIFPEPKNGNLWEIYVHTSDTKEGLLNDNRRLRKFLTSLFFEESED